jgi:hypothetical protein
MDVLPLTDRGSNTNAATIIAYALELGYAALDVPALRAAIADVAAFRIDDRDACVLCLRRPNGALHCVSFDSSTVWLDTFEEDAAKCSAVEFPLTALLPALTALLKRTKASEPLAEAVS